MHVLCGVCGYRVEGRLSELRRELFAAAHSPGAYAGETSGVDKAGLKRRRVPEARKLKKLFFCYRGESRDPAFGLLIPLEASALKNESRLSLG